MTAVTETAPRPPVDSADVATTRENFPTENEAQAKAIEQLKSAGIEFRAADALREKAHAKLREAIREAEAAGVRPQYMIQASGAARETIYKVLREVRKPDDAAGGD